MGKTVNTGVCLLAIALAAVTGDATAARRAGNCADATDISALQTSAVQQQLMDSALGCGHEWVEKFNAFQTAFGPELRRSDRALLTFFKRIYGPSRGDAEYNLFKTNMASKAEMRRVRNVTDFCASAQLVFAAALAAEKPTLNDFVAGVQINDTDDTPVGKCEIQVALTLKGAQANPEIVPTPNPLRMAAVETPIATPPDLTRGPLPSQVQAAQQQQQQAPVAEAAPAPKKEEKKGFLSGLFGN
ncbi:MAG TPA: hypothetical protein VG889_21285 [Rhizomicrobium sp.]|nr:hypothetical protein [Rhizomicrobium sp.]